MRGRTGRTAFVCALLICLALMQVAMAQDAVPGEILQRTIIIRTATKQGTAFKVDYLGKVYLVTARHMVTELPTDHPTIQTRLNGIWADLRPTKIIFPSSDDVDIAVFKTDEVAAQPFGIVPAGGNEGVTMGQQIWFLGYPFPEGLSSRWKSGEIPFIKRGTMSAIDGSDPNAVILYVDGFNNEGFSGGPILFWSFSQHRYELLGVVKGYRSDTAKQMVNGQEVDTNLLVNSGILVGYSIKHAMDAIEKDQEVKK